MKIVLYNDRLLYRKENSDGGYSKWLSRLSDVGDTIDVITNDHEEERNFKRDEKEVIAKQPDILVVNAGINEVWRGYWKNDYIQPEEYEKLLVKFLKNVKSACADVKIILIEPTISFSADKKHWKRDLEGIIVAVRKAAIQAGDDLIPFDGILAKAVFNAKDKTKYTVNGIALTEDGERLLAEKIEKSIELLRNR